MLKVWIDGIQDSQHLLFLSLKGTRANNDHCEIIAKCCIKLCYCDLSKTAASQRELITDKGAIAVLSSIPSLCYLGLARTAITCATLNSLQHLPNNADAPKLQVDVTGCHSLAPNDTSNEWKASLPPLRKISVGQQPVDALEVAKHAILKLHLSEI